MRVMAIDPGTTESAWVIYHDSGMILGHGKEPNEKVLDRVPHEDYDQLVVEMFACYGMAVGAESFETVVWIGRFLQAADTYDIPASRLFRKEIALHLCGSSRAKDPNVRQALIDRFGAPGTKKAPGATYGLKADEWSALAIAVTFTDRVAA